MPQGPSPKPVPTPAANTLRLAGHELNKLAEELDLASAAGGAAFKRTHHRWPFRHASIRMEVSHPSGATTSLHYACRNVSSGGVSLLHSSYVHTGTRVVVHIPRTGPMQPGQPATVAVTGKVLRCRHFRGSVHEIGVKFDRPVEIREVLDLDPLAGRFTLEHVEPEKLRGTLLHVDDSVIDRKLVRHFLRETQLNVVAVNTGDEALQRISEGFDAILCDYLLPGGTGADLCLKLREQGVRAPVIIASAFTSPDTRAAIKACQADAFLLKPFARELLLRALAEYLLVARTSGDRSGAMFTSLSADDPMASMVPDFVEQVHALAKLFRAVREPAQIEHAVRECMHLQAGAPPMGFARLAEAAERAADALMKGSGDLSAELHHLASVCERVADTRRPGEQGRGEQRPAA